MYDINSFIHLVFISFIALFPVINPIGCAFMVNPFFDGLPHEERKKMVFKTTLYIFYICIIALFSGKWILELFGLSIPVVRIAGGLLICKIGWDALSDKPSPKTEDVSLGTNNSSTVASKLFYPIAFPITAGGGTISVLFTLSAHATNHNVKDYFFNILAVLLAIIGVCTIVFFMYLNTNKIVERIGSSNQVVLNRIMAFLILCVGLQIASSGVLTFLK